ncbi:MAG: folylpolyglutamate synthase/dihydrofolate synthase family protein [Verrucomicrobiota bacterium]
MKGEAEGDGGGVGLSGGGNRLEACSTMAEPNYQGEIEWLYGVQQLGVKLGLENMQRLLEAMGHPEEKMKFVHVAGTNGKGSVCAMGEAMLRAGGVKTGLFTSPHLVSYCERIKVNGRQVAEDDVARLIVELRELVADWDPHPTFFELTLGIALRVFEEAGVEVAVLETGLGGRLDSTNVILPEVSAITPISYDHQHILGDTLAEIAGEKAGIIKPGVPVVSSPQKDETKVVLERFAEERQAPIKFVESLWTESNVGIAGEHQRWNAALAVEALRVANLPHSVDGLADVKWPARFDRRQLDGGMTVVIDGAHNPSSAEALAKTWRTEFGDRKATLIFSSANRKDVAGVLQWLSPLANSVHFVPIQSARAVPPEELKRHFTGAAEVFLHETFSQAMEAMVASAPGPILIAGSLFLAGEAIAVLESGHFEVSLQ